ncbi:MAG: hypothetical protein WBV83_16670 [Bradyrhizobium sp.]|jgi:hypothetical protein|uniref:hypothetical protein n=1 Tax=Bradyrhizobium sp. TaxID=376 RepID=UPI003C58D8C3
MVIDLFEIFLETFRLQISLTAVQPYVGDGAAIKYAPKGNQENGNGIHNEPKNSLYREIKSNVQGKYYRPPTRFGAAIRGVRARQRQYLISLPVAPPLTIVGGGISITGSGENALANAPA